MFPHEWVLALFPPASRRRYGEDLLRTASQALAEAEHAAWPRRMILSLSVVLDMLKVACAEWIDAALAFAGRRTKGGGPPLKATGIAQSPSPPPGGAGRDGLGLDIRLGLRRLRGSPGYTLVTVITLGLAVGANAAIFGVVRGVLLEPLPYPEPDRLVTVWGQRDAGPRRLVDLSQPDFVDLLQLSRSFDELAAVGQVLEANLSGARGDESVDQVRVGRVTSNFFRTLGVAPRLGTDFGADTGSGALATGGRFLILSSGLWTRAFGADPGVVGTRVTIDGESSEVLGVLPAGFGLLQGGQDRGALGGGAYQDPDIWIVGVDDRHAAMAMEHMRVLPMLRVVGRLRAGVTLEEAQDDASSVAEVLRERYPVHAELGSELHVASMSADLVAEVRPTLLALWAMVVVVLLIACGNVAAMSLVRASRRRKEFTVQAALGGSRLRLIRQLLIEGTMLAAMGAGLGIALGYAGNTALLGVVSRTLPRSPHAPFDATFVAFLLLVVCTLVVIVGLVPAFRATSGELRETLAEQGRGSGSRAGVRLREGLIVSQIGISVVLVVMAALMVRSFTNLESVDLGYETDVAELVSFRLALPSSSYRNRAARLAFFQDMTGRLESVPGVEGVAVTWPLPFAGEGLAMGYAENQERLGSHPTAVYRAVTQGYFDVVGATLLSGRALRNGDEELVPLPVVVNEEVARYAFDGRDPIGRTLWIERDVDARIEGRVVGLVGDLVETDVTSAGIRPTLYVPYGAITAPRITWVLAHVGGVAEGSALADAFRREVMTSDPTIGISDLRTIESYRAELVAPTRFAALMMAGLGALGLGLAMFGLFGTLASSVEARRQEIGLRMALGASGARIRRNVLGPGLAIAGLGLAIGGAVSLVATRAIEASLFGVSTTDPLTFLGVGLLILITAALACWIPSERALAVDSVTSLRSE